MHVFVTRFCALNALLFRDLILREANEENRISLLMLVWGMAPFHLYFLAVKKLISTLRSAYQEASVFYSSAMGNCPEGFDACLFKELILYLFLMDSRDIQKEAISWMEASFLEFADRSVFEIEVSPSLHSLEIINMNLFLKCLLLSLPRLTAVPIHVLWSDFGLLARDRIYSR